MIFEEEDNGYGSFANEIMNDVSVLGNLNTSGDMDAFTIYATEEKIANISFNGPTASDINFFDIKFLGPDFDILSGIKTGTDRSFSAGLQGEGWYTVYVEASDYYTDEQYELSVSLSDVGNFEIEDNFLLGNDLVSGIETRGQLSSIGDYDTFVIYADGPGFANIAFDAPTDSSAEYYSVEFMDSNYNTLAAVNTGSDSTFSAQISQAGYYETWVTSWAEFSDEEYGLTVTFSGGTDVRSTSEDLYEENNSINSAYQIGGIYAGQVFENLNIHEPWNDDYFEINLTGEENLKAELIFNNLDGDLDFELLDEDGYWIDFSMSSDDNEELSLAGLPEGTYYLVAYGYDGAVNGNYSLRFSEVAQQSQAIRATEIDEDLYEDNDSTGLPYSLGEIVNYTNIVDLNIDKAYDDDFYSFYYDGLSALDVSINFDHAMGDLDLELLDSNGEFLTNSGTVNNVETISLYGYSAGTYIVGVFGYGGATNRDYSLEFSSPTTTNDEYDSLSDNGTIEEATDLSGKVGSGTVTGMNLLDGEQDWYKFSLPTTGSDQNFISVDFDHNVGDIDIDIYDSNQNWISSSQTVTDQEKIYFSDWSEGEYFLNVYQYSSENENTGIQSYEINHDFPVDVNAQAVEQDIYETNDAISAAKPLDENGGFYTNLTLHSSTDEDWFKFDVRNTTASSSLAEIAYDSSYGGINFSLRGFSAAENDYVVITESDQRDGSESILLGDLQSGTYYLKAASSIGGIMPEYSLNLTLSELDVGGSSQSSSIIFQDHYESNNGSNSATELGKLDSDFQVNGLSIHDLEDVDWVEFSTKYDGIAEIDLTFTHGNGDLDVVVYENGSSDPIARSDSGDDNEHLSFNADNANKYQIKVWGYNGAVNRDYSLTVKPPQLESRPDSYENNNSQANATVMRGSEVNYTDLSLHNASDEDWYEFVIPNDPSSESKLVVSNYTGDPGILEISSQGSGSLVDSQNITNANITINTSGYAPGKYYATIDFASNADQQAAGYDLYINTDSEAQTGQDEWTIMVYIGGDNNLASAAVDDINEMEAVHFADDVNVVTWTDLSNTYSTSAGWTGTKQGLISYDPGGYYNNNIVSNFENLGEKNSGSPVNLTNFLDYSTSNYPAEKYALILWDHGGGIYGVCSDDTDGHDILELDEIKAAVNASSQFSSSQPLDLIGYDACLMQILEYASGMSDFANVMVASQETEPGDGWDYEAFLSRLQMNPQMDAAALGSAIVDTYYDFYNDPGQTLSTIDLTKIDDVLRAIDVFNGEAERASGADWTVIHDAADFAWNSNTWTYPGNGDDIDLGGFFNYIGNYSSNPVLSAAANEIVLAIETTVTSIAAGMGQKGLTAYINDQAYDSNYRSLLSDWNSGSWKNFLDLYNQNPGGSSGTNTSRGNSPDYYENRSITGETVSGNNTNFNALDMGYVLGDSKFENLTIHNETDVDWYEFRTGSDLSSTNHISINSDENVDLNFQIFNSNLESLVSQSGESLDFLLNPNSEYLLKVSSMAVGTGIGYEIGFSSTANIISPDVADLEGSNDELSKATELDLSSNAISLENLSLTLTEEDTDFFSFSPGRISEQTPNLFVARELNADASEVAHIDFEIYDSDGELLGKSISNSNNEVIILESYTSDIFLKVDSDSSDGLIYGLQSYHADYDINKDQEVESETDGTAIVSSMFSSVTEREVSELVFGDEETSLLTDYLTTYGSILLDVDRDGEVNPFTDGLILKNHLAGIPVDDLINLVSESSPIETANELSSYLLEIS